MTDDDSQRRRGRLPRAPLAATALAVALLLPPFGPSHVPAVSAAEPQLEDDPVPPDVRAAVDRGLTWLAAQQRKDGSWQQGFTTGTAVPSLAVMAFLARGHVPGQGRYGGVIEQGVDYVLGQQRDDGMLSADTGASAMYEHGISASMLSEVYGMLDDTRKRRVEKALAKAVALILSAQQVQKEAMERGGWRYERVSHDSDISVTGWQLMALRGAANCGAAVPKAALDAGRDYVRRCAKGRGGGFTYQAGRGEPSPARTGTGILSLEMLGEHASPEAIAGGEYLLRNPLNNPDEGFYYYGVYYVSQAFYQLGGRYWSTGYPKLRDELMKARDAEGSWGHGSGQESDLEAPYRTSMAILALCVPFRYLPLYQK